MALETRKGRGIYYTRSHKVAGRVIREYVASGEAAILIARLDEIERNQRYEKRYYERWELAQIEAIDRELENYWQQVEQALHAQLVRAGYHQHDRGQWRRQRGKHSEDPTRA
jgi:hypothetical protein